MKFSDVVDQARALLQRTGKLTYRVLKREFALDDEALEDLKEQLIDAEGLAVDQDGKMLVWTGPAVEQQTRIHSNGEPEPRSASFDADAGTERPRDTRLDTAERRQLTVMFCDLVGSTALSEQLDPEELRDIVQRYQKTCADVIRRYDGHIAQHLGDGILVYFGYPIAHEDDAQRAVRTGLEIITALQKRNGGLRPAGSLQVRIGIHTGLVVIGEMGSPDKREILALGETPNMAARLQGLATPDTVMISAATQRLVQGFFICQDVGVQELKGLTTPVAVYHVLGESGAQSRFEAAVHKGLTPLVGREHEVGLLLDRWEQAKEGRGQVVLLSGEPGIGKSRLASTLKERVTHEGSLLLEARCSPYHQQSALYPLIDMLQRTWLLTRQDTQEEKVTKFERALSRYAMRDTVPLFTALLSLPTPSHYPPLNLTSQKQKERTLQAVLQFLTAQAERHATVVVWEDVHWADPSSLEFLTLFLEQAPITKLLLVVTFRPEFTPPWGSRGHLTHLTVSRLERPQVEAMVKRVTGEKALPSEVVQQIVTKTDGVPLFVEELTKTIVESELLTPVLDHYELRGPLPPFAIPSTLQDSLMARLDRLAPVKEIAQLGAVLGREFSYELLHAVSSGDEATLQQGLKQLVDAEILYQRGLPPQASYFFKHALIQDTAYQSLLKSTRQHYHQQIAQILETQFPATTKIQPELLAHHYTEAGLIMQAIPYWQIAGQRALERSANTEAISHLTKGLELLTTLPDTPERVQQELLFQTALGPAWIASKSWAAPEVEQAYARARKVGQRLGETPQLFPVLWGLWAYYGVRAEVQKARELSQSLLTLAQKAQDSGVLMEAQLALGHTAHLQGEFAASLTYFERGMALYNPHQHRPHAFLYGQDPGVICSAWSTWPLWHLGYPEQAVKRSYEALTRAQHLAHPFSLAFALGFTACLHQQRRELQAAHTQAEATVALCQEQRFPFFLAWGTIIQSWVISEQGEIEKGLMHMRQGLAAYLATGTGLFRSYFLALLAEGCGRARQSDEGLDVLAEAFAVVNIGGERNYEAELYRLKGELTLQSQAVSHQPQVATAEESFLKAIEIARRQQAKSLELRAATSLARLWRQQDKQQAAHQLLAKIYGLFTEGFDTKDLQEAKALLAELGEER